MIYGKITFCPPYNDYKRAHVAQFPSYLLEVLP